MVDSLETSRSQPRKGMLLGYVAYGLLLQLIAALYSLGEGPDVLGAIFGAPLSVLPAPSALFVWWAIGYLIAHRKHRMAFQALCVHYSTIPIALGIQIGFWGRGRPLPWSDGTIVDLGLLTLLVIPYMVGQIVTWHFLRARNTSSIPPPC